jgi:hypothetical protein
VSFVRFRAPLHCFSALGLVRWAQKLWLFILQNEGPENAFFI